MSNQNVMLSGTVKVTMDVTPKGWSRAVTHPDVVARLIARLISLGRALRVEVDREELLVVERMPIDVASGTIAQIREELLLEAQTVTDYLMHHLEPQGDG